MAVVEGLEDAFVDIVLDDKPTASGLIAGEGGGRGRRRMSTTTLLLLPPPLLLLTSQANDFSSFCFSRTFLPLLYKRFEPHIATAPFIRKDRAVIQVPGVRVRGVGLDG